MARSTSTQEAEILTIKQVAAYLQVTERTVYRLAAADGIPAFKVGGSWRFRRRDLDQWIANSIGKASAPNGVGANVVAPSFHSGAKTKQVPSILATEGSALQDGSK